MGANGKTTVLKDIAKLRDLQSAAAEDASLRAANTLRDARSEELRCETAQSQAQACWREAMEAPILSLDRVSLWGGEMAREAVAVTRAQSVVVLSEAELERRRRALVHAALLRRAAQGALRAAQRKDLERGDVRRLEDVLDRHSQPQRGF